MPSTTTNRLGSLHVVEINYRGSSRSEGEERSTTAFHRLGAFDAVDIPKTFQSPEFPEALRTDHPTHNLGLIGGAIADLVHAGSSTGTPVVVTGGDCSHLTGVLGGLQDTHGPDARIGLVWFDAHGDFNTPKTTLTGMLGGMPVAVSAGLAYPRWRESSHLTAPIPTDRIVMVDVRNLDAPEAQLIKATEVTIAAVAEGFPGCPLQEAIDELAEKVDYIYLHIDSDILDERFTPNHGTKEPNGPDIAQVQQAVETVMQTGKVIAFGLVSVYGVGEGHEISQESASQVLAAGLQSWSKYGMPSGS